MAAFDYSKVQHNNKIKKINEKIKINKFLFLNYTTQICIICWIFSHRSDRYFHFYEKILPGQQNVLSFVFSGNKVGRQLTFGWVSYQESCDVIFSILVHNHINPQNSQINGAGQGSTLYSKTRKTNTFILGLRNAKIENIVISLDIKPNIFLMDCMQRDYNSVN